VLARRAASECQILLRERHQNVDPRKSRNLGLIGNRTASCSSAQCGVAVVPGQCRRVVVMCDDLPGVRDVR